VTVTIGSLATALRPADSQQVFRAVLEALARPGSAMTLPSGPLRMLAPRWCRCSRWPTSAPECVLENEIPHSAGEFQDWADAVATATSAPLWPAELARLVPRFGR
jgi:alpha-D-ribose 1-methylphosphonate 5-triphosphate synthase subunit PhnH